jgi:hypothetical protein
MVSGKKGELHVLVDHPFSIHSYTGDHSAFSVTPLGMRSLQLARLPPKMVLTVPFGDNMTGDNMPFFSPSSTTPKLVYLPLSDRLVVRGLACLWWTKLLTLTTASARCSCPRITSCFWSIPTGGKRCRSTSPRRAANSFLCSVNTLYI